MRVLLVDDEPDLLDLCRDFLEMSREVSAVGVVGGAEALAMLQAEQFDAIISDYQMPKMDGIQLLREVRARHGGIPFILFTGRGREDVVIQALDGGVDAYLQKGGDPKPQFAELAHRLKQVVERHRALDSLQESEARLRRAEGVARLGHWELVLAEQKMIASEGACALYGVKTRVMDLRAAQSFVLPEYRSLMDEAMRGLMTEGIPYNVEFKIRRADDGRILDIHSWAEYDEGRGRIFGVIHDITERKQLEDRIVEQRQHMVAIYHVIHSTARSKDPDLLLQEVLDEAMRLMDFDQGGVYLIRPGTSTAVMVHHKNVPPELESLVHQVDIDREPYAKIMRRGEPWSSDQVDAAPDVMAVSGGLRFLASVPIMSDSGPIGALNVASIRRHQMSEMELDTLTLVGQELGAAIDRLRKCEALD